MKDYSVTLKALRQAGACYYGYNKLVRSLQGLPFTQEDNDRESYLRYRYDDRIPLGYILKSNGLDDALWSLRACEQTPELLKDVRLYTVWCARQVQHLMTDASSIAALDTAEKYVNGQATEEELSAARVAAYSAAYASAYAAYDTYAAARVAAYDTYATAARVAAYASAYAADSAYDTYATARVAAYASAYAADSARTDVQADQANRFIEVFCS